MTDWIDEDCDFPSSNARFVDFQLPAGYITHTGMHAVAVTAATATFLQHPTVLLPPCICVGHRPYHCSLKVYEWLRAERAFHEHATEEWGHKAGLYLTARASAKEFVEGVRARVGEGVWRPYLEPHVLRFFFRAKRNGLPDVYQKVQHTTNTTLSTVSSLGRSTGKPQAFIAHHTMSAFRCCLCN